MKKTLAAVGAGLLALSAQSTFAQSSVTLYGLVDTSVRYLTNANSNNDSQVSMGEGVETPSRFGLKGTEDLGGGTSAVFKLENQFQLWSGKLDNSNNTLFQRNAYVGLSNNQYGTLTFGRQQTPFFDVMGNTYDPLTVGDFWQDSWIYNPVGRYLFTNSSAKYTGQFGGLQVEGMYGFGGVPGSTGQNSMYGFTASYALGPLSADVGFQQNDNAGKKFNLVNVSAVYAITPSVKVLAGWLHSQDNTGLVDGDEQQAGAPYRRQLLRRLDVASYAGAGAYAGRLLRSCTQCGNARRHARRRHQLLGHAARRVFVVEAHRGIRNGRLHPWHRCVSGGLPGPQQPDRCCNRPTQHLLIARPGCRAFCSEWTARVVRRARFFYVDEIH
jgi:predicted porin